MTPCHVASFSSIQVQRSVCSHTDLLFRPLQPFEPLVVNQFQVWGSATLPLSFSLSSGRTHRFDWEFTVAAVDRPILGADFLRHHQFDVSIARHLLVSVDGEVQLPLLPYSSSSTLLSKVSVSYQEVLAEFPEIVGLGFAPGPTKHDVRHHVETKGPPISTPARRLDPQKYAAAKAEFERMEKAVIVRRSNSPWASALHMVPKPDGSWRPWWGFSASQQCYGSRQIM